MIDMLHKMGTIGKRLAEAGREARAASAAVTGELTDQMTQALGVAAGEVVRAAVIGAVAAVMRAPRKPARTFLKSTTNDSWNDLEDWPAGEAVDEVDAEPSPEVAKPTPAVATGWATATRSVGSALTVAAGAAASVPGGRLVAAGLGAVAAVATLAARAGEHTSS